MENLYRILNCSETASFQELKKSYQSLALQYHPDKSQQGQACSEKFVRINRAWKVLSDARLREQYDARWRERCFVQAYPVQDSVDFVEFEKLETCSTGASELQFRELQESRNSGKCKPVSGCEVLQDQDAVKDDPYMDRLSGDIQSTESNPKETEINTSVSDEIGSHLSHTENESTGVQGLLHNSHNTIYKYDCRCGGSYVLTDVDVQLRFDIVCCDTCSLSVQVIYDTELEGN